MITTRCNASAAKHVSYILAVNDEYIRHEEMAIFMCKCTSRIGLVVLEKSNCNLLLKLNFLWRIKHL